MNNFCNSGVNKLRKLTIPGKISQPLIVVGRFSFCLGSNLLLSGFTQTTIYLIKIVFPIYCNTF